jgi:hypothetical protein
MAKFLNIHEEAVQSYIRPGGEVNDLLNDVARDTKAYGAAYISNGHIRSGRLLRGLFWNRAKLVGPLQGVARAGSSAKHTVWFHDGTAGKGLGYIRHPNMIVPKNRHAAHTSLAFKGAGAEQMAFWKSRTKAQQKRGRGFTYKNQVRGQRAKPFLREGLAVSLAKHGLK